MRKAIIPVLLLCCGVLLFGCGSNMDSHVEKKLDAVKSASNNKETVPNASMRKYSADEVNPLLSRAQTNIRDTVGQAFLTIRVDNGKAYTWDQGATRQELQDKIDKVLTTLKVIKEGVKQRPPHHVALLFQNISVIIPYDVERPETNILIENDEGTFIGECNSLDLQSLISWLKDHHVNL